MTKFYKEVQKLIADRRLHFIFEGINAILDQKRNYRFDYEQIFKERVFKVMVEYFEKKGRKTEMSTRMTQFMGWAESAHIQSR